jgi:hypothetical protein
MTEGPGNYPPGNQYPPTGGPPPGGFSGYPGGNDMSAAGSSKGFFGALFDFSFNSFVTPMIVKFVYVLATIGIAIGYLVFLVSAFANSAAAGIIVLIVGAIGALVYLAFIRMTLEFYYAVVRMSQDINQRLPRA